MLQFKKSAAVAATKNIHLRGVSETSPSMVQTVVDNFDADIYPQNGKGVNTFTSYFNDTEC